jgi:lysozyme family protein
MSKFEYAFGELMKLEGGFVEHDADPGKATNWGISQRSHPTVDIVNLTKEGAMDIYKKDYWPWYMDSVTDWTVAAEIFEILVNIPPEKAVKIVQRAMNYLGAGIEEDGQFGAITLRSLNHYSRRWRVSLLKAINGVQFMHYLGLVEGGDRFDPFARGWLRRIEHPS